MMLPAIQYCKKCGEYKEWCEENFYVDFRTGKLEYHCKQCRRKDSSKRNKANRQTDRGWARDLVNKARERAKLKGLPCDITVEWILLNTPLLCPVLGIPLKRNKLAVSDNSPTLDRINNLLGYIIGNVQIISMKANRAKNNLSFEEIERLYLYYQENNVSD
jgi:hypothetical protein